MVEVSDGFESFVSVVEHGSISAASRHLGTPRETLGRRLQRLEERLGVRLVHRSSRTLTLTAAGQALFERARPLVLAAREAEDAIRRLDGVPRGVLRLSLPPFNGDERLPAMLQAYLDRYPEVSLEAELTARHVDLVAEGVDVALRAGTVQAEGLMVRTVLTLPACLAASPAYLARKGRPRTPEDLRHHDLILGMSAGTRPVSEWVSTAGQAVSVTGRWVTNDRLVVLEAIRSGAGIGWIIEPHAQAELDSGVLERVLPGHFRQTGKVSLVFVERELMPPKVCSFIDHVAEWVKAEPWF